MSHFLLPCGVYLYVCIHALLSTIIFWTISISGQSATHISQARWYSNHSITGYYSNNPMWEWTQYLLRQMWPKPISALIFRSFSFLDPSQRLKLFGCQLFWLWAYPMKVIPKTRLRFFLNSDNQDCILLIPCYINSIFIYLHVMRYS